MTNQLDKIVEQFSLQMHKTKSKETLVYVSTAGDKNCVAACGDQAELIYSLVKAMQKDEDIARLFRMAVSTFNEFCPKKVNPQSN